MNPDHRDNQEKKSSEDFPVEEPEEKKQRDGKEKVELFFSTQTPKGTKEITPVQKILHVKE